VRAQSRTSTERFALLINLSGPDDARIPADPAILDIRRDLLPGATVIDVPGSWIKLSKLLSKD
jgi:hypothetical protein